MYIWELRLNIYLGTKGKYIFGTWAKRIFWDLFKND